MISISAADYSLQVLPEYGAAVAALKFRGIDILRPASPNTAEPLHTAAFPLVPFANRIGDGTFRVEGTIVRLPRNAPGQRHPLHGHGWRRPWRLESAQDGRLALDFEHVPDEWPWHYRAQQVLKLDERGLTVTLAVENLSDMSMPAGLGWHPYFHRSPRLRLRTHVQGMWLTDSECLPTQLVDGARFGDWSRGGRLPVGTLVDHCYSGWDGTAEIEWPERMLCLRLTASESMRWLHVYVPPAEAFFCIEPVTHMPDALNRLESAAVTGVRWLAAGESCSAEMRLGAVPLQHEVTAE